MSSVAEGIKSLGEYFYSIEGLVFLFGKVCLFTAVGVAVLIGESLRDSKQLSIPAFTLDLSEKNNEEKAKKTYASYNTITKRNIFGVEKSAENTQSTEAPKTKLSLRLVGASVTEGGEPFAIIEDTKKKEQDVFDLDESVFGYAKLIEIKPESVRLERNGTIELLVLEAGEGGSITESSSGVSASEDGSEFTVAEDELSKALANLPRLLSQARAVPYFRDGQSVGMRLFAIRRGSLYEKLGLKNGDILTGINGNNLSDPSQALKLFELLKNERSINVVLERQGNSKELKYAIE